MFAKIPPMIAKQDDDRVVIQSKVCETVQHRANLGVSVADGRMIGVHEVQCLRLFKQPLWRNSGVTTQLCGVMNRMRRGAVRCRVVGRRKSKILGIV